jgi:hypothetical protein
MSNDFFKDVSVHNPVLFISESDFDPLIQSQLQASVQGVRVLAEEKDTLKILYDSLPEVITKRLKAITPPDFKISQLELKIAISGKFFGASLQGDVIVRLAPKDS